MTFTSDQEFVTQGRPVGSRNKRTKELFDRLKARGDLDPADFLSALVTNEKEPKELRVQASGVLLPYIHPKWQSTPAPRFIDNPIDVPEFTSVEIAESFLAKITYLVARGELDIQQGLDLAQMTNAWIATQNARTTLELKAYDQSGPTEQVIRVTGGLPELPTEEGHRITMPMLDGHAGPATNGHALEGPGSGALASEPSSETESIPSDPPTQE